MSSGLRAAYSKMWYVVNRYILSRNVDIRGNCYLSLKSDVKVDKGGRLDIKGSVTVESGSFVGVRKEGELVIGKSVYINRNCNIVARDNITISDGVTIGPGTCIYDHDHNLKDRGEFVTKSINIGKHVWIGANVIILKGVEIGNNSVIAAGSVITCDVPPNTVVVQKRENTLKELV